jgi:oligopeptide/dipeptide ABC transporter ATP-binding protein
MRQHDILVECSQLVKEYKGTRNKPVRAVHDLSFSIRQGETFGLVGESGCGKSTLGQLMVRLLEPTSGTVRYTNFQDGRGNRKQEKAMRKENQIIFQDPYSSINPRKRIGWLVEEPLIIHGIGKDAQERKAMVCSILKEVGLDDSYLDRWPRELSGGQRQRVAIAIALILNPSFVVCDEVVSALDVSVQAQVLNLLQELQEKFGLTYLFISHNLQVVSYLSDRIGVMYLGGLVEMGDTEQIYHHCLHPYTKALFSASVDAFDSVKEDLLLSGDIPSPSRSPSGCPFHTRCISCMKRCIEENPRMVEVSPGHFCACHLIQGMNT